MNLDLYIAFVVTTAVLIGAGLGLALARRG